MSNPASSVVEHFILDVDQLVADGASFRFDKAHIANNTAGSVLVLFMDASDTDIKAAVVVDGTANEPLVIDGIFDTGCLIKAAGADVHVTLCRSAAGA
jgi:hypothetical protein